MQIAIYSLSDPRTNHVRYIGKTKDVHDRFMHHLNDKKTTRKSGWIKSLKKLGLIPTVEILDKVSEEEWEFWEMHYISLFKSWGFSLTNHTDGGGGMTNATPDTKLKMSLAQTGKKHSSEAKQKQRLKQLGVSPSAETRDKLRKVRLGKKQPPEAIAKTVAANTGRKNTQEMKDRQSRNFKGRRRTLESLAKMAKTNSIPILQYDLDGNFIQELESIKAAQQLLSPNNHGLSDVLKGKRKTWQGFKWKYKE